MWASVILISCESKISNSKEVFKKQVNLNEEKLLFPVGSTFRELEDKGIKLFEVELPEGYFFRVNGEVGGNVKTFTCSCSQQGNCYPVLSVGPKGYTPSCLSEGCSHCNIYVYDRREGKMTLETWEIEIGNAEFVKNLSQLFQKTDFANKKIKPLVSFTRLQSLYAASEIDLLDVGVQNEINDLVNMFYRDLRTEKTISFPKIDFTNGKIPKEYSVLPLEVSGKYFFMVIPNDNGLITLEYRTLPHYDFSVIKCYGSCTGGTCKSTSAPGSNGTTLIICSGCPNSCKISY